MSRSHGLIGWLVMGLVFLGLNQFSVYHEINQQEKYDAWMSEIAERDTTFGAAIFVYVVSSLDTVDGLIVPDTSLFPVATTGAGRLVFFNQATDSVLVMTYDTVAGATVLDSATTVSMWASWGLGEPQPYVVAMNAPGSTPGLGDLGLSSADSAVIADIIGYPYLADIGVSNMTWGTRFDSIYDFWYGLWRWADWTADSVLADSAGSVSGRSSTLWTSLYTVADSLCAQLFVEGHTYYDRPLIMYSKWWRTGDTAWMNKGNSYLRHIRDCYWAPNSSIQPYRQFTEGLNVHYRLTGDTVDLRVAQQAAKFDYTGFVDNGTGWWSGDYWGDARTQGRVALGLFMAYWLDYDTTGYSQYLPSGTWESAFTEGLDSLLYFADYVQDRSGRRGKWSLTTYGDAHVAWQVHHTAMYTLMRYVDLIIQADTGDVYDSVLSWAETAAQYFRDSVYVGQAPGGYEPGYGGTNPGDDHNILYMAGVDTSLIDTARLNNHHVADSMIVWLRRYRSTTKYSWGGGVDTFPSAIDDSAVYRLAWQYHYDHQNDSLSMGDGAPLIDQKVHYAAHPAEHSTYWGHVGGLYDLGVQQSGMALTLFAWLFKETGDSTYWTMADTLIQGIWYAQDRTNGDAWYYTPKLDNENYFQSQRSIYWLNNPE